MTSDSEIVLVDAKGKICPLPLIMTKKALKETSESGKRIRVEIDNEISFDNVCRYLKDNEYPFEKISQRENKKFVIDINGPQISTLVSEFEVKSTAPKGESIFLITSNVMGQGDDDLGKVLIQGFINTLADFEPLPETLIFYNKGVTLATKDSSVADSLSKLINKGVKIFVCGTCVNFFEIPKENVIGTISNMYEIIEKINKASKIIRP